MKHFITSILFSAVFAVTSFAQNTTEVEYNYLTKGYKTQVVEQGGDLKQGYYFDDSEEWSFNMPEAGVDADCKYKVFRRAKDKSVAGILVIFSYTLSEYNQKDYYCIPSMDFDGQKYSKSVFLDSFYTSLLSSESLFESQQDEYNKAKAICLISFVEYSSRLMTLYYKPKQQ